MSLTLLAVCPTGKVVVRTGVFYATIDWVEVFTWKVARLRAPQARGWLTHQGHGLDSVHKYTVLALRFLRVLLFARHAKVFLLWKPMLELHVKINQYLFLRSSDCVSH